MLLYSECNLSLLKTLPQKISLILVEIQILCFNQLVILIILLTIIHIHTLHRVIHDEVTHIHHQADIVHDHHLADDIQVEDDEVEDEVDDGRETVLLHQHSNRQIC